MERGHRPISRVTALGDDFPSPGCGQTRCVAYRRNPAISFGKSCRRYDWKVDRFAGCLERWRQSPGLSVAIHVRTLVQQSGATGSKPHSVPSTRLDSANVISFATKATSDACSAGSAPAAMSDLAQAIVSVGCGHADGSAADSTTAYAASSISSFAQGPGEPADRRRARAASAAAGPRDFAGARPKTAGRRASPAPDGCPVPIQAGGPELAAASFRAEVEEPGRPLPVRLRA